MDKDILLTKYVEENKKSENLTKNKEEMRKKIIAGLMAFGLTIAASGVFYPIKTYAAENPKTIVTSTSKLYDNHNFSQDVKNTPDAAYDKNGDKKLDYNEWSIKFEDVMRNKKFPPMNDAKQARYNEFVRLMENDYKGKTHDLKITAVSEEEAIEFGMRHKQSLLLKQDEQKNKEEQKIKEVEGKIGFRRYVIIGFVGALVLVKILKKK